MRSGDGDLFGQTAVTVAGALTIAEYLAVSGLK
jgi:hypothetical protein